MIAAEPAALTCLYYKDYYNGRRRGRFARDTVPVLPPVPPRRVGARATSGSRPAAVRDRAEIAKPPRRVSRGGGGGPRARARLGGAGAGAGGGDRPRPPLLITTHGAFSFSVRTA